MVCMTVTRSDVNDADAGADADPDSASRPSRCAVAVLPARPRREDYPPPVAGATLRAVVPDRASRARLTQPPSLRAACARRVHGGRGVDGGDEPRVAPRARAPRRTRDRRSDDAELRTKRHGGRGSPVRRDDRATVATAAPPDERERRCSCGSRRLVYRHDWNGQGDGGGPSYFHRRTTRWGRATSAFALVRSTPIADWERRGDSRD